jgi:HemX protein
MMTQDWLTDAVLYIYALSLLFFASDAASGGRSARKMGTGLLVFVWLLQTAFLLSLLYQRISVPELSMRDFLFFVSWLLVSGSFILNRWMRAELLIFFVNVIGFAVLALNLLQRPRQEAALTSWEAASRLLVVHISFMTVAFAILTVAAIFAGMYLFLHNRLKQKRWSPVLNRMPSLETIDRYAFRFGLIGVPLLYLSLSTGTVALLTYGEFQVLWDVQAFMAICASLCYAVCLIRRSASGEDVNKAYRFHLLGYAFLLAALILNAYSRVHMEL